MLKSKEITQQFQIPDTREGWVESLKLLLESYFHGQTPVEFDYSLIRKQVNQLKALVEYHQDQNH